LLIGTFMIIDQILNYSLIGNQKESYVKDYS
jgi:hypothetical protein